MKFIKDNKLKVNVVSHNGVVGVFMDTVNINNGIDSIKVPYTLNNPQDAGQLGSVVKLTDINITQEAFDLLNKAPREGGSFAPFMIDDNTFGYMGFTKAMFSGEELCKSRDCDLTKLKEQIKVIEIPQEFIEAVEA